MNRRHYPAPGPLLLLVLFSLLSACATQKSRDTPDFDTHQRDLAELSHWQVEGKLGLRQDGRGNSARLRWQQSGEHYAIQLSGPLGAGAVIIEGDERAVLVRNSGGEYRAANPEQLVKELTGWQIPVRDLTFWARGMPSPTLEISSARIEQGRLAQLSQGGWLIEYKDYSRVKQFWLPAKMTMSRAETRLTLVFIHWLLPSDGRNGK